MDIGVGILARSSTLIGRSWVLGSAFVHGMLGVGSIPVGSKCGCLGIEHQAYGFEWRFAWATG